MKSIIILIILFSNMQNISFKGTHRSYYYNRDEYPNLFPIGEQDAIPIAPMGIMTDGSICFSISYNQKKFFHQVSFRGLLRTLLQEIVSGSNLWDYQFSIYKEHSNNIRVKYYIKGKDHPLSKFLKFCRNGNSFFNCFSSLPFGLRH